MSVQTREVYLCKLLRFRNGFVGFWSEVLVGFEDRAVRHAGGDCVRLGGRMRGQNVKAQRSGCCEVRRSYAGAECESTEVGML